jgi:hypothetical protein
MPRPKSASRGLQGSYGVMKKILFEVSTKSGTDSQNGVMKNVFDHKNLPVVNPEWAHRVTRSRPKQADPLW